MSSENKQTQTRILKATVEMLEKHAGRGVRMADIAKQTGISRQAIYLHFASRTELLDATTRYLDEQLDLQARLRASRRARSGVERIALYVAFWGNYIPEIYSVAKSLLMVLDTDEAAAKAWDSRMQALRHGCQAAVDALDKDGELAPQWTKKSACDVFFTLLSVPNWEIYTQQCGWSNKEYIDRMTIMVESVLREPSK